MYQFTWWCIHQVVCQRTNKCLSNQQKRVIVEESFASTFINFSSETNQKKGEFAEFYL